MNGPVWVFAAASHLWFSYCQVLWFGFAFCRGLESKPGMIWRIVDINEFFESKDCSFITLADCILTCALWIFANDFIISCYFKLKWVKHNLYYFSNKMEIIWIVIIYLHHNLSDLSCKLHRNPWWRNGCIWWIQNSVCLFDQQDRHQKFRQPTYPYSSNSTHIPSCKQVVPHCRNVETLFEIEYTVLACMDWVLDLQESLEESNQMIVSVKY